MHSYSYAVELLFDYVDGVTMTHCAHVETLFSTMGQYLLDWVSIVDVDVDRKQNKKNPACRKLL